MTTTITRRTRITRTGTRRPLPGDHETAGSRETSSFAQLASLGILGRLAQRGMDPLETENLVGEERGPVDTGGTEACESTERCSLSDGSCVASGNKPSRSHASRRRKCGKLWPTDSSQPCTALFNNGVCGYAPLPRTLLQGFPAHLSCASAGCIKADASRLPAT